MPELTAAEAWCWVAWMLSRESDALVYAWPKTDAQPIEADVLRGQADACHARALSLDAGDDVWRSALDKWDAGIAAATIPSE
jgi:hypothetical protein